MTPPVAVFHPSFSSEALAVLRMASVLADVWPRSCRNIGQSCAGAAFGAVDLAVAGSSEGAALRALGTRAGASAAGPLVSVSLGCRAGAPARWAPGEGAGVGA